MHSPGVGDFSFFGDDHTLATTKIFNNQEINKDETPEKDIRKNQPKVQRQLFRRKIGKKFQPPIKSNYLSQDIASQGEVKESLVLDSTDINELSVAKSVALDTIGVNELLVKKSMALDNTVFNEYSVTEAVALKGNAHPNTKLHVENESFSDLDNYIIPNNHTNNFKFPFSSFKKTNNSKSFINSLVENSQNENDFNQMKRKYDNNALLTENKIFIATPPETLDSLPFTLDNTENNPGMECTSNKIFSQSSQTSFNAIFDFSSKNNFTSKDLAIGEKDISSSIVEADPKSTLKHTLIEDLQFNEICNIKNNENIFESETNTPFRQQINKTIDLAINDYHDAEIKTTTSNFFRNPVYNIENLRNSVNISEKPVQNESDINDQNSFPDQQFKIGEHSFTLSDQQIPKEISLHKESSRRSLDIDLCSPCSPKISDISPCLDGSTQNIFSQSSECTNPNMNFNSSSSQYESRTNNVGSLELNKSIEKSFSKGQNRTGENLVPDLQSYTIPVEEGMEDEISFYDEKGSEIEMAVPVSALDNLFSTPSVNKKAPFSVREIKEEVLSPFPYQSNSLINGPGEDFIPSLSNELEGGIIQWCLQQNVFEELERQVENADDNFHVIEFNVNLSVQDILDFNAMMGTQLIQHPIAFFNTLKQICFAFLNSRNGRTMLTSADQILYTYKITNMLYIDDHTIKSKKIHRSKNGLLLLVPCQVLSMSCKYSYTKSATYYCSLGCQQGCLYLCSDVGSTESDIIRNDLLCSSCSAIMEEDVSKRILSEKRYCLVLPKHNRDDVYRRKKYNKCIKAIVKDEVCDFIEIGCQYWFTCILQYETPTGGSSDMQHYSTAVLDVVSVEKFSRFPNRLKLYDAVLPDFLCSLYQDRLSSPWSFVASLAFCFLDYVTPTGSYFLIKYILLLNLIMEEENTNENNEKNKSFHVLLMGKDVMMYQRMLFEASSYTTLEASIYRQPINLFGCVMNDGDNFVVHGGSLAVAASSVCVIPNLLQLKKSEVEQLSKVCESHEVTLKLSRSDKHQLNQVSYPFNGSLWCCIESIKENETLFEPLTRFNTYQGVNIEGFTVVTPQLINLVGFTVITPQLIKQRTLEDFESHPDIGNGRDFLRNEDFVVRITGQFHVVLKENNLDETQADDQQIAIASHLLKKSTRFSNIISKNDIKQFIKAAQATKVTMLGSSEDLLKAYYLLYRNSNPSYSSNVDMELLTHLATAHAKAMFHEEVTIDDAVLSICLFEQLLYQKTSTSLFGVKTTMFFNHDKMSFHIGPQNDERLTLLKEHIISYCSSRLPHIYGVR